MTTEWRIWAEGTDTDFPFRWEWQFGPHGSRGQAKTYGHAAAAITSSVDQVVGMFKAFDRLSVMVEGRSDDIP